MPLYEYECARHGTFELSRSMSQSKKGAPCPACHKQAPRILSLPNLSAVERSTRIALDRNEKSRHEPRLVSAESVENAPKRRRKFQQSHGRPWALEHG